MSNARMIFRLVLLLLLLAGAHVFLCLNDRGEPLVSRTKLVVRAAGDVTGLTVERAGERPVVLVKKNVWRLESPFAALADEGAVMRMIDAVTQDAVRSAYSEGDLLKFGRTRRDYGFDAPQVVVKVATPEGACAVSFASLTPVRDGVFAAVEGDPRVYVVGTNILAAADVPADAFRETALIPAGTEGVDSFELKRGKGSLQRFRLKDGAWTKSGVKDGDAAEKASDSKVRDFLSALGAARATTAVWPVGATNEPDIATTAMLASYGLDSESSVAVTLRGGGPDRQVVFGKAASDGSVYALVQDGGAVVTADGAIADLAGKCDFTDTRIFPLEERDVTRVSVTDGGVTCLLARDSDGAWRLDAPIAAAADSATAASLVAKLLSLRAADRAERGLAVSLSTNSPAETVSRDAVLSSLSLADLRSRDIISVDPADVKRLSVLSAGFEKPDTVVFDRDLREWTVESSGRPGTVVAPAVSDVLAALSPLRAEKVVKLKMTSEDMANYGLDTPRWTIAVDSFQKGGLRRNILIGEKSHGGRFATLGASDAVFVLSDETVSRLTSPVLAQ